MTTPESVADAPWAWDARRMAQLGVLALARLFLNTGLRMVYPFAPAIGRGLGVPTTTIYSLISIRNLLGLLSPVFAPLSERYGRRVVMVGSAILFGLGALLVGFIPTVLALGVTLAAIGLAKVIYDPAMQSYLGDTVPYHQRGRALSVTELAWGGSFLLGAPIVGWLIANRGWQSPFLWLGIAGLLSAVLLRRFLPPSPVRSHQSIGLAYTGSVLRRHPIIWAAVALMFLTIVAQEALFIVYGDWMEQSFDLSLTGLGLATTVIGLAELTGEAMSGWLVDRFGKRRVTMSTGVVNALCYLAVPLSSDSLTRTMAVLVVLFITFEITVVGSIPLLTELVPEARAVVMSMSLAAMAAGRAVGSAVGPVVWTRAGIAGNSILAAALMLAAVFVLARYLREDQGKHYVKTES